MAKKPSIYFAPWFLFACLIGAQGSAWAESKLTYNETNPIELDAATLNLSAIALREFQTTHKNWRCFSVSMYFVESEWRVDFSPKDDVQDAGDKLIVGASKCGRGMSFVFDKEGRLARREYSR